MKLVVIGGTGLIGSRLVARLRDRGHDAVAASPDTGVNTITGLGLAEALQGASTIVDVSNSPSFEEAAVMDFFTTSTRNLLASGSAAGVTHYVALSVVGTERIPDSPYLRAKNAQEVALGSPLNDTVDVAGPQQFRFDDLIRQGLRARNDPREVVTDPQACYYGINPSERALLPGPDALLAETRFSDWFEQQLAAA